MASGLVEAPDGALSAAGSESGERGSGAAACAVLAADRALGLDQLGEPANLALHRLEAVAVHLDRVAVDPLTSAPHGAAEALALLLEPDAPTLEDAHPRLGRGLGEEGEVDAERLVLPRRRARLAEQLGEALLAFGGQRVDDLAPAAAAGRVGRDPAAACMRRSVGYSEP